ncbi:hypothetical protein CL614_09705, partial [archaeon]|nr:hypothetical protein [archaeon]
MEGISAVGSVATTQPKQVSASSSISNSTPNTASNTNTTPTQYNDFYGQNNSNLNTRDYMDYSDMTKGVQKCNDDMNFI